MSSPQQKADKPLTPRHAWQPLTPRGVAAFAFASLRRLLLVQFIVAGLVSLALLWFLRAAWFPVITEAVQELPASASIRRAELACDTPVTRRLAGNRQLAILLDLQGARNAATSSDLEIIFEKRRLAFCGALGCWSQPYPDGFRFTLDRAVVEPAWGAWQWPLVIAGALVAGVAVCTSWWLLSLLYLPFVKILIFLADRQAGWLGAWRMSAAGLLPGALIAAGGFFLYGFGAVDLFRFGLIYVLHLLAGLVFVFTSPFFLPRVQRKNARGNPFARRAEEPGTGKPGADPNPFSRGE